MGHWKREALFDREQHVSNTGECAQYRVPADEPSGRYTHRAWPGCRSSSRSAPCPARVRLTRPLGGGTTQRATDPSTDSGQAVWDCHPAPAFKGSHRGCLVSRHACPFCKIRGNGGGKRQEVRWREDGRHTAWCSVKGRAGSGFASRGQCCCVQHTSDHSHRPPELEAGQGQFG